jgi:hypothetical protein
MKKKKYIELETIPFAEWRAAKRLAQAPEARVRTCACKLSLEEMSALNIMADKFCEGNTSLYLRAALFAYKPKKSDFSPKG